MLKMKDVDNSLNVFLSARLVSLLYIVIFVAKKKYFTKPNLFDLLHWSLVILIPMPAAIPVLFSISPKSDIILIPYWIGVMIWIALASWHKLNHEEEPLRNKLLIQMGGIFFAIGISGHLLLHYLSSLY